MKSFYHNAPEKFIIWSYLLLETVLFFLILWSENTLPYAVTGKIMYSSIVLNFLVMAFFCLRYRGDFRIPLALTLTLAADFLLTYLNRYFIAGVFCFILVQSAYWWKLGIGTKNAVLRLFLALFWLGLLSVLGMPVKEGIFCSLSMGILSGNVICAWTSVHKGDKGMLMLAAGLTLFAGCDFSLGLRIVTESMENMALVHHVSDNLTWVFYLPSQVILCLCYIHENNKKHHCL